MTQGTLNLKRKVTQTVSARQLVRAEMATKVVRHAVAVTPDTCFHEKGRFKVNKHQSRNTFNWFCIFTDHKLIIQNYLHSTTTKMKFEPTYLFFFITINQPTYSLFWLNPTLAARLKHRLLWNCEIWDWDNENEGDHELQEQQQVDWKFFYGGRWNAVAVEDGTMLRLD